MKARNDFYVSREDLRTKTSVPREFLSRGGRAPKTEKESTELLDKHLEVLQARGQVRVYKEVTLHVSEGKKDWSGAKRPRADRVLIFDNWGGHAGSGRSLVIAVECKRDGFDIADACDQCECYKGSTFKLLDSDIFQEVDWAALWPCERPGGALEKHLFQKGILQIEPEWFGSGIVIKQGVKNIYSRAGTGLCRSVQYRMPRSWRPRKGHKKKDKIKEPMK
jgi:hypothetical protein